ncbi:MAG: hypothetical protein DRI57_02305 [Deltaproteobacteria bacterium]|nr:MAG: hypothetical protein DRI57_02305 [Deltaproteobacteria bacterium]
MKKQNFMYMTVCIFIILLLTKTAGADCEQGKSLYERAVSQQNIAQRITLLRNSVAQCENFNAYYELGKAYEASAQFEEAEKTLEKARDIAGNNKATTKALIRLGRVYEKTGRLDKAEDTLKKAQNTAEGSKSIAKLLARLGLVYEKMGKTELAYTCFRDSYDSHPYPKVYERFKALGIRRMEQGVSAEQIKTSLLFQRKSYKNFNKGFQPQRSGIDLPIHFKFDSTEFASDRYLQQAKSLGEALINDSELVDWKFTLIGHTDIRGTEEYNQILSEQRAEALKTYLVREFSINSDRIRTEGRGEKEPEHLGNTEDDHDLNRRVKVEVEYQKD